MSGLEPSPVSWVEVLRTVLAALDSGEWVVDEAASWMEGNRLFVAVYMCPDGR